MRQICPPLGLQHATFIKTDLFLPDNRIFKDVDFIVYNMIYSLRISLSNERRQQKLLFCFCFYMHKRGVALIFVVTRTMDHFRVFFPFISALRGNDILGFIIYCIYNPPYFHYGIQSGVQRRPLLQALTRFSMGAASWAFKP